MRYFLAFFLVLGLHLSCFSQTITGTVREKGSGLPLSFANVFVNNTTIGSATDAEGRFRISGDFSTEIEVVASFIGFVTEVKVISFRNKGEVQVDFELASNESNLSEIELKAKRDKSWDREFRRFEEIFLALPDDPYKSQIRIVNPWVVEFEKVKADKGPNYLTATAESPLKIINEALGYEIDYYLQDYRVMRTGSMFYGQVFYSPTDSSDPTQMKDWEANREANYQSSLRHFNYSLLTNTSDSIHFKVFRTPPKQMDRVRTNDFNEELGESIIPMSVDSIFRKPLGNGNYRVYLQDRLEIHHLDKAWRNDYYTNVYHAISWIQAPEGYYDVDKKGTLINPTQLVLSGYLSRQRMARILPLDFEPNRKFVAEQTPEEVLESPAIRLNKLREKAWLTTNKPYFYPGETVWMGGKMLYQDQNVADSLSRVLYVDLINTAAEIVQSATFPIEQGKISGGLDLAADFPPGDYALRAYTHWNQNFGTLDQFLEPFLVMESGFQPKGEEVDGVSLQGEITVNPVVLFSDSLNYRVMDLKLEFLDEFQNPIAGEFILAITDADAVSAIQPSISLEEGLNWLDKKLPVDFNSPLTFPIEYGISIQGKFTADNKRRPAINPITVVRGDLEDYGQVITDSLGNFWATGLVFKDTAQIAIAAIDDKQRPYGSVELLPLNRPKVSLDLPKFMYTKEPILEVNRGLDVSGDYVLLDEFVKEEAKEKETLADQNYGYGTPNRELGEEELVKLDTWEQVFGRLALFSNYNYGEKTGFPMVILNGQKFPFIDPGEILSNLVPAEIESIKVYNDNISKSIFGMWGYAGVYMIETKKGIKTGSDSDRKFNSEGFQIFDIPGFTDFPVFDKNPPSDQLLKKKPTLYWEPAAQTSDGSYHAKVKVLYGVKVIQIRVEGLTLDGEVFSKAMKIEF